MLEKSKSSSIAYKQKSMMTNILFGSRWLQLPLYLGLIVAQAVYVYFFGLELVHLVGKAAHLVEADIMLIVLGLIDVVMISNLLIMVNILLKPWIKILTFQNILQNMLTKISNIQSISLKILINLLIIHNM